MSLKGEKVVPKNGPGLLGIVSGTTEGIVIEDDGEIKVRWWNRMLGEETVESYSREDFEKSVVVADW